MKMEKIKAITQGVLAITIVLLLLVTAVCAVEIVTRGLPEGSIITRRPYLYSKEHEIEVVEDLFIPFEFQDGRNFTFLMTENFSELMITVQPDTTTDRDTIYKPIIEIDGGTEVRWVGGEQHSGFTHHNYEITELKYNATYTLSIFRCEGVAVAF